VSEPLWRTFQSFVHIISIDLCWLRWDSTYHSRYIAATDNRRPWREVTLPSLLFPTAKSVRLSGCTTSCLCRQRSGKRFDTRSAAQVSGARRPEAMGRNPPNTAILHSLARPERISRCKPLKLAYQADHYRHIHGTHGLPLQPHIFAHHHGRA
jgi:hypothetical protein